MNRRVQFRGAGGSGGMGNLTQRALGVQNEPLRAGKGEPRNNVGSISG